MDTVGIFMYAHSEHSVNMWNTHICIHVCYVFTCKLRKIVMMYEDSGYIHVCA